MMSSATGMISQMFTLGFHGKQFGKQFEYLFNYRDFHGPCHDVKCYRYDIYSKNKENTKMKTDKLSTMVFTSPSS
jgi:hypothetical protein